MKTKFSITRPDEAIREPLQRRINDLTKPKGALGTLESLALQIGWIQQTIHPQLTKPYNVVFASDHGIVDEGVSFSPKEVTRQMIFNFLEGGAGVNFLARQHGFGLKVVDAGVDYDFPALEGLIDRKIRKSTRNYLHQAAMSSEEAERALEAGAAVVDECRAEGCNVISFGEMGIANTSSSSMWMHLLTGIPLKECIGAGSGLDNAGITHKYNVLQEALQNYRQNHPERSDASERDNASVWDALCYFGGYEMVMAVGGMLRAAERGMVILIDGFIMTNCILMASRLLPEVLHYAIYAHQGDEAGHKLVLDALSAEPILHLGLRLGEGTGAICAYPILESAVRMINEMSTFSHAEVTKYY